jgi:hypothetical protein
VRSQKIFCLRDAFLGTHVLVLYHLFLALQALTSDVLFTDGAIVFMSMIGMECSLHY